MATGIEIDADTVIRPLDGEPPAPDALDAVAWLDFLRGEVAGTRKVFLTRPKLLLGHVRNERQTADDYAGRELLELVQNAADAAAETGGGGRVRIEIGPDGLVVANTGAPFRTGGVESLMTANASDKPGRRVALIGAKGLGFRALLNWSHEPLVSSGSMEVGFSREHARRMVEGLAAQSAAIAALCAAEEEPLVPVLAFPAFGADLERPDGSAAHPMLGRARALRAEGYDTVVAAPFDDAQALDRAIGQAAEFEPTFLLFVTSIEEIELRIGGRPTVRWRRAAAGRDAYDILSEVDGRPSSQSWICMRRSGEAAARGRAGPRPYELAVALRTDAPNIAGNLHSFFPTSVPLPFPALFHATLELASNRKAIKDESELNGKVLAELARFYAETLASLARSRRIGNALDFLARSAAFPAPLLDFEATVYRTARALAIVPTLKGGRTSAGEGRVGPAGYGTYLPARLFGGLAKCRDQDRAVLDRLGMEELPAEEIVRTLRRAELTLEERAKAVVGIALTLGPGHHHRSLLLDAAGRPMKDSNLPFPPPAAGDRVPSLPDWARARFIHPELWRLMLARLEGQTWRDKLRKLAGFGVSEYSSESVIASLRAQAARALTRGRRDAGEVQRSLLRAVHSLYEPGNRNPPGLFKVLAADGLWRDSRELHLSSAHGVSGRVNSALFRSAPQHLMGSAHDNGVEADPAGLDGFLEWIGVNRWPRAAVAEAAADLRPMVLRALPDPIVVQADGTHKQVAKHEVVWGYNLRCEASVVVGLEEMLATAESDAILSWLALDPRFDPAWPHRFATTVTGRRDGKENFRRHVGTLPDLVRERIAKTPWLACRDGGHHSPRDAMAQPGRLADLFAVPRAAAVGSEEAYGLTQAMWRRGLEGAGVPQALGDLPAAGIFALLEGLHARALGEDLVRRLYQQVLELDRLDAGSAPSERARFLAAGRVQVHRGRQREWVPPADALYADQSNLPLAAREFLALVDLPPRRNTGNVAERFGVAAIGQQGYSLELLSFEEETGPAAAVLRSDLAAARPFIRALRLADANVTTRLRRFDRLELRVARSASIAVRIGGSRIEGPVEPWTHVLDGDVLIVAIEALQQLPQVAALAHEAIADGIAEVFDIQSGAEFAKLIGAQGDGLRAILLRRMLPNLSDCEIADLLTDVGIVEEPYEPVRVDAATLARGPAAAAQGSGADAAGASAPPPVAPAPPPPARPASPAAVSATPVAAGPTLEPFQPRGRRRIGIRVARATGPVGASPHPDPHRAADAEEWCGLFEVGQGRFPLYVGHLQGGHAYGCDWLSFATADDLEAFRVEPVRTDLVARFIETKSGAVELSDNETRAAETRRARYFIYRVQFFSGERGQADLTIVGDPLAHRQALLARYEFRMDAVETRERFQLTPEGEDGDEDEDGGDASSRPARTL